MPPGFGVSSVIAVSGTAPRIATRLANGPDLIAIPSSDPVVLSIEPDCRQILIDEVRRADLEALHIGPIRHDPMPPQYPDLMRPVVEHIFFEVAHQGALPRRIGFMQHLLVEVDRGCVLVMAVIL